MALLALFELAGFGPGGISSDHKASMPILVCKRVQYFSQGDETAFFEWIGRISCVTRFNGSLDELYLHVRGRRISDRNLWELLALFHRYRVSMKQLAQFESPRNRTWFRRPGMYWEKGVWGSERRVKKTPKAAKTSA